MSPRLPAWSNVTPGMHAEHLPAPVPALDSDLRPRVSVVVTCFNYARYLPLSVGSVLHQTGIDVDVVIVDDASTDNSGDVARALVAADPRVRLVTHEANTGAVVAFNDGLAATDGEFVVRLDADDLLTRGSLARAVALAEYDPSITLVYGHPLHFTGDIPPPASSRIRGWTVWPGHAWVARRCREGCNCITAPEVLMRGDTLRAIGGMNPSLRHTHDLHLWLRLAANGNVGRVDGPDQALHRDHPASLSATSDAVSDLVERRAAFALFFAEVGHKLIDVDALRTAARRALAQEALERACRAYDRGRLDRTPVDELVAFASDVMGGIEPGSQGDARSDGDVTALPQWRALERRRRLGPARPPVVRPSYLARSLVRRAAEDHGRRRWERFGV